MKRNTDRMRWWRGWWSLKADLSPVVRRFSSFLSATENFKKIENKDSHYGFKKTCELGGVTQDNKPNLRRQRQVGI